MTDTDTTEIRKVLSDWGNINIDPAFIQQILLEEHDVKALAADWGWSDTEVRGLLLSAVAKKLIGKDWPTYSDCDVDIKEFVRELQDAHDAWLRKQQAGGK